MRTLARVTPRRRSLPLALFALAAFALSVTSAAWALGELSQKPGAAGCVSEDPSAEGCQVGRALHGAGNVAISPDGRNAYVVSGEPASAVAIFDRDPATGALQQRPGSAGCVSSVTQGCAPGRALLGAEGIAVSPDGMDVYVASHLGVAIFARDAGGGLIQKPAADGCVVESGGEGCQPGRGLDLPTSVAVSPDGRNVYVASRLSRGVAIFDRDSEGKLTQKPEAAGCVSEDGMDGLGKVCEKRRALSGAHGVAVSPDGRSVYVASLLSRAVAIFDREPDGGLRQAASTDGCVSRAGGENCGLGRGFGAVESVVVSPDGGSVYSGGPEAIGVFDRDSEGKLRQKEGAAGCVAEAPGAGCDSARGLAVAALAIDPDGENLYVASGAFGMTILDRGPDGGLTQKAGTAGCISKDGSNGCERGRALGAGATGLAGIAASPDGRNVYATSFEPGAIAIFDRGAVLPSSPPDTTAPTVSGFRLSPARFRAAPRGNGAHFAFNLSEPASVSVEIQRALPGRAVGKRCKPPTPRLAKHRPCKRLLHAATLRYGERGAGANAIRFNGRTGRRALAPGAYRATILATDAAGNRSAPRGAGFTVLVGRPAKRR